MKELERIYIRARDVDGKWGSFSLQELLDMGVGGREIGKWFHRKVYDLVGLAEGETLTKKHTLRMVGVLEHLGYTIVRIKETL